MFPFLLVKNVVLKGIFHFCYNSLWMVKNCKKCCKNQKCSKNEPYCFWTTFFQKV